MARKTNSGLAKENEALKAQVAAPTDANKSLVATEKKLRSAVEDAQGWEERYKRCVEQNEKVFDKMNRLSNNKAVLEETIELKDNKIFFLEAYQCSIIAAHEPK